MDSYPYEMPFQWAILNGMPETHAIWFAGTQYRARDFDMVCRCMSLHWSRQGQTFLLVDYQHCWHLLRASPWQGACQVSEQQASEVEAGLHSQACSKVRSALHLAPVRILRALSRLDFWTLVLSQQQVQVRHRSGRAKQRELLLDGCAGP